MIFLSSCRNCSDAYSYPPPDGENVTILLGIPGPNIKYKAISHVWGTTIPINMRCKRCSKSFTIPLRSVSTFFNIMALGGPGSTIWLDNMSIDQSNHQEKAEVVAVMGDIYSRAESVSVLLPADDEGAFRIFKEVVRIATTLLERKWRFNYRVDESVGLEGDENVSKTAALARRFWTAIKKLLDCNVKYWQRAWTFQEWALAHDIEMACDLAPSKGQAPTVIRHVKSTVVFAAIIVADYKLRFGQWALMDVGFNRGEVTNHLEFIKILFPFEDAFASFEEVNYNERLLQCALPHFGTNQILGLRSMPRTPRTSQEEFRARLILMLDAFATREIRTATYKADLVCCWASMCNIQYEYVIKDSVQVALAKVIRAIRKRGVQIYNFQVNGDEYGLDVDLEFFEYAAAQQLSSSTCLARMPGAPIFTGWTDTARHFYSLISKAALPIDWPLHGRFCGIHVRGIKGAFIKAAIPLSSRVYAIGAMHGASSGIADGTAFTDAIFQPNNMLQSLLPHQFAKHAIVVVAIPTSPNSRNTSYFCAWAVITLYMPIDSLFVAREELNGTLVLAAVKEGSSNPASIFAYLTVTDHQCGSSLIKVKPEGEIDMVFKTPPRTDMARSHNRDRHLQAQLAFADNAELSADSRKHIGMHSLGIIHDLRINDIEYLESFTTNDPVIQPFGENPGLAIVNSAYERMQNGELDKHSPVNLDVIGHPHLIPLAQQEQEEALRLEASVPREINSNILDRLKIVQIPAAVGTLSISMLDGLHIGQGIPGIEENRSFKALKEMAALLDEAHKPDGGGRVTDAEDEEVKREQREQGLNEFREATRQQAEREVLATRRRLRELAGDGRTRSSSF